MGNHDSKQKKSSNLSGINYETQCPLCGKVFNTEKSIQRMNDHLALCGKNFLNECQCEIYSPKDDSKLNKTILKNAKDYKVSKISIKEKSKINVDNKIKDLKTYINSKKISWDKGCCTMHIKRNNLLKDSMEKIEKVNLLKEVKIQFEGEEGLDAGGLFREWFNICFKSLESDELKLLIVSESNEFSYNINPLLKHTKENFTYFYFIGKLIAKALFDNITINICFNKLIYKMILQEEITLDDLLFIDNPLYTSLHNLKELAESGGNLADVGIYYSVDIEDINHESHSFNLIDNGINKQVENINDFINKRIFFIKGLYEPFIKKIRDGLFSLIKKDVIQKFTSDELELIINGRPFIDVDDWKNNTEYAEPYNKEHKIIKWFWEIVYTLDQKQLSNLLMFSTGTSRVPFGGFAALESNRGNLSKFKLERSEYNFMKKNFIKAHTCFNRLEVPEFDSKEEMEEAIKFISSNEIIGFGIE